MKVQVEEVSNTEKRLSIEVDAAMVEQELSQAYAALSRQVKVPGFRPGKVPRRILEQKYKDDVEADVTRRVQVRAFVDAAREHKVFAVGDPHFSGGKLAGAAPFAFVARVEVKPKVAAKDYKGISLKVYEASVPDAQVNEQIERIRTARTELEPIAGRDVVQKGDMAVIDFEGLNDGQPFPGSAGKNVTVEVVEGQLIDGNLPQLEGVKLNVETKFNYTFPADYRVEEVKGKTTQFTCTVKELKSKKVPALDDKFAESVGGGATMAELIGKVRADLERAVKNRAAVDEREEVFKKLIEKNAFDVPQAMVDRGTDILLESALQSMARSGVDPRMLNLDWSRLRGDLKPRAESEVRGQLLLEAIAEQEKLAVTDEDVEKKLEGLAAESGLALSQVRKQFKAGDAMENLKVRLLEDKALEFVKSHATREAAKP